MVQLLTVSEETATSWVLTKTGLTTFFDDSIDKSESGDPAVRALIYRDTKSTGNLTMELIGDNQRYKYNITKELGFTPFIAVNPKEYQIAFDGNFYAKKFFMRYGGVYTIIGFVSDNVQEFRSLIMAEPNSMHIFWLLPQYVVITMGEVMFSVTGLEFAFTQAPLSMKSLLQASWLLTVAIGNLIVVIIAEAHFFKRQVRNFLISLPKNCLSPQVHSYNPN